MKDLNQLFQNLTSKIGTADEHLLTDIINGMREESLNVTMPLFNTSPIQNVSADAAPKDESMLHLKIIAMAPGDTEETAKSYTCDIDEDTLESAWAGNADAIAQLQKSIVQINAPITAADPISQGGINATSSDRTTIVMPAKVLEGIQNGDVKAVKAFDFMVNASDAFFLDMTNNLDEDAKLAASGATAAIRPPKYQGQFEEISMTSEAVTGVSNALVKLLESLEKSHRKHHKPDKSQEKKEEALKKIQDSLSDGIQSLAELSEIAGMLSDIPSLSVAFANIMDEIKQALQEYIQSQIGVMSSNEVKDLAAQINSIISEATGGDAIFDDTEIAQMASDADQAQGIDLMAPNVATSYGKGSVEPGDFTSVADIENDTFSAISKPRPLDLNSLISMTRNAGTNPLAVQKSQSVSSDVSSDQNAQLRSVAKLMSFLDSMCIEVIDRLSAQLGKMANISGDA